MATALQQVKSGNSASSSALAITITSSLSGSVLWVWTAAGGSGITLSLPTDSATQTYTNLATQAVGSTCFARMDDRRNTASGVTSVTVKATAAVELSGTVQELTGTNNALDSTVPALTSAASASSLATSAITTVAGSILAAGVTDTGGGTGVYTVSPTGAGNYTVDGLTPNGANERIGSASNADTTAASHTCTFTPTGSVGIVAGQAAYQAAGAAAQITPPLLLVPTIVRLVR